MENKENVLQDDESKVTLHFSKKEEREYYLGLKNQLIKLLYLIEDEANGQGSAELYFYGFMYELKSANILCDNKLTKICIKMFGLFNDYAYKTMGHDDIKRQIFECKGIVDHLIKQIPVMDSH